MHGKCTINCWRVNWNEFGLLEIRQTSSSLPLHIFFDKMYNEKNIIYILTLLFTEIYLLLWSGFPDKFILVSYYRESKTIYMRLVLLESITISIFQLEWIKEASPPFYLVHLDI